MNYSDQELLMLLDKHRKLGFDLIFERYWQRLFRYAYAIYTDDSICEDIVQEVFVSLWENSKTQKILSLEAYLLRAVKNRVINHLRDLKFTREHQEVLNSLSVPAKVDQYLEYDDVETLIYSEIDKLPPKCKKVFLLSRFEDVPNAEIATKLNISIRTVEKHISEALKHLRTALPAGEVSLILVLLQQNL